LLRPQSTIVFVARAIIEDVVAARVVAAGGMPIEPPGELLLAGDIADEDLLPYAIQPLQSPRYLHPLFQAVIGRHQVMVALDAPAMLDVAPQAAFVGGREPAAAIESLSLLVALDVRFWQPAEFRLPDLVGIELSHFERRAPCFAELDIPQQPPRFVVVGVF